ncbi:hypothetical protein RB2083_3251 [Rhodobacteraceae bacterium HTCC2083]|nr:hypothetical protein RB2083_3251 [Rhodobacteraceae bacterium HTCC2083]
MSRDELKKLKKLRRKFSRAAFDLPQQAKNALHLEARVWAN